MPAAEQGRFSTPVSSKHHDNAKENTRTKQDEVDLEGPSPPPLAAPLSDDTLDASSSAEKKQAATAAADRPVRVGRSESPFAATPSPIGNRTLSNSEDITNDDTIDGTFDTDNNYNISRTLNISEIDESASLFLNSNNNNTVSANGEASSSSRRKSITNDTANNTTLKSILELSEIDTTFDGAALNRTIGATDASTSSSSRHRPPRDLSEIDTTMDAGTAGSTRTTGNTNSIEESKLQAELAADASERMQRMLEEATSASGGADGGDENSTLAGQAFVGGGSGASVMTSGGSMASYSVGGNTVATAGTDIADFLRKQNEAMQRALAGAGVDVGEETIISPTKTRAVDAAVENARIMAEATAKLTPGSSGDANVTAEAPSSAVKRNSSMEFGSQSHLNVCATGKFTTDDATGAVTVQSVKTNVSDKGATGANNKSTPNSKSVRSNTTLSSSSSAYQSQYALSPSQRAKESMTLAEKIRHAEAEAMARDGGPTFEKMAAVNETDADYVPIADYSLSAKKNKKKQGQTVGSFDYNDYSPDNMMSSPESAVQRYRIMMRRKKRRRQRRMIRAGLVALVIGAVLFWWYRGGTGNAMVDDENDDSALENDEDARPADEDEVGVEPPIYRVDNEIEAADERPIDVIERENTEEVIENDDGDSADQEDSIDGVSKDSTMESEADSLASAFAREKIQLINADQAPIVKLFIAAKAGVSRIEPRAIPFSHLWNKEVRQGAKSQPVLSGIDELLDSMMQ